MSIDRLKSLIELSGGEGSTWDQRVGAFAITAGRSKATIYRWLTVGAPENALDAIEFRLHNGC